MVKFYIYNTSNGSALELYDNEGNVTYEPFTGAPNQQWEFTLSLSGLQQWTVRNVSDGKYLQPSITTNPTDGNYIRCRPNPVPWKFESLTLVPLADSVFKLKYNNLAMTIIGTDGVVLRTDAGQTSSGSQIWQLKAV